jgi:hypothetical protein
VIITTKPDDYPDLDLQEVATHYNHARSALDNDPTTRTSQTGLILASALALIPPLATEVRRLRKRLASTLADLRDLAAAARATLSAQAEGEPDPLYYLRDELQAQGQIPRDEHDEDGTR